MNPKVRNWLIGVVVIIVFVLGVPLVQLVFAGSDAPAKVQEDVTNQPMAMPHSEMSHPQVIKVGDQYLRLVSSGENSLCAMLYDSDFTLLAVNESEAVLNFTLPNGEKKSVNIIVPAASGCEVGKQGSSSKSNCCVPGAAMTPAECPHTESPAQK